MNVKKHEQQQAPARSNARATSAIDRTVVSAVIPAVLLLGLAALASADVGRGVIGSAQAAGDSHTGGTTHTGPSSHTGGTHSGGRYGRPSHAGSGHDTGEHDTGEHDTGEHDTGEHEAPS